jgi:hypothetical protein
MAGAARIAAAAYLDDREDLDKAWLVFRQYSGDGTLDVLTDNYSSYSRGSDWIPDESIFVGINPKGSINSVGYNIDGVIPNDQSRGGSFKTPPGYTQYPWEGLQGAYMQALVLSRTGYPAWDINDQAMLRAVEYQWFLDQEFTPNYSTSDWWDDNRDVWVKYLALKAYGENNVDFYVCGITTDQCSFRHDEGRINGFTTWTHQNGLDSR